MLSLEIIPAYGRTYKTAEDAAADWKAGFDFMIHPIGPYCSIRDAAVMKKLNISSVVFYADTFVMRLELEDEE